MEETTFIRLCGHQKKTTYEWGRMPQKRTNDVPANDTTWGIPELL